MTTAEIDPSDYRQDSSSIYKIAAEWIDSPLITLSKASRCFRGCQESKQRSACSQLLLLVRIVKKEAKKARNGLTTVFMDQKVPFCCQTKSGGMEAGGGSAKQYLTVSHILQKNLTARAQIIYWTKLDKFRQSISQFILHAQKMRKKWVHGYH